LLKTRERHSWTNAATATMRDDHGALSVGLRRIATTPTASSTGRLAS
jgi:hypothetical protein